jgi:hypothetical protein
MYVNGSIQTSLLEEQEETRALEINKCLFFIPNIAPSKVALGITKGFHFPKESFDYAQLDKEVPLSLKLSTQELKLELDVLMD